MEVGTPTSWELRRDPVPGCNEATASRADGGFHVIDSNGWVPHGPARGKFTSMHVPPLSRGTLVSRQ